MTSAHMLPLTCCNIPLPSSSDTGGLYPNANYSNREATVALNNHGRGKRARLLHEDERARASCRPKALTAAARAAVV